MKQINSLAVLYASEGTGHKSAALAIKEAYKKLCPNGHAITLDVLDVLPPLLKKAVAGSYMLMARHIPQLWGKCYRSTDKISAQSFLIDGLHNLFCGAYLKKVLCTLEDNRTDAVIFTHYFAADNTAKALTGKIPVFNCDTDFESHRFQRGIHFTQNFCASERSLTQRADSGILNAAVTGIPVAQKYRNLPSREEARKKLGIDNSARAILVSGGGIGSGAILRAAESCARDNEVFAVCGSNVREFNKIKTYFQYKENVHVLGFVPDMENYYAACDAAVMKPGGLSSSEALCAAIPMLLMSPVPGQEELNMDYLISKGTALPLLDPAKAGELINAIFADGRALELAKAAKAAAAPDAAQAIIKSMLNA